MRSTAKRMNKSAAATLKLLQQETWYTSSEAVRPDWRMVF